ncbi:MAG: alpha/beta fold hydrolase, partial [Bacteroidota bacterium]
VEFSPMHEVISHFISQAHDMNPLFQKFFLYLVAFIFLLYICVCIYLFFIQEKSIFPARKIPINQDLGFSLPHEEIFLDTPDGARVHGVMFPVDSARGVVLHFHGNGENVLDLEQDAKEFLEIGYTFLAMDYRSYGKSTGKLSEKHLFEDALLFMQFLEKRGWKQSDIIVYGRSIGTGIATQLASVTQPRGLILYSPYYSMRSLVGELLPFLPTGLILQYPLNTAKYLKAVDCPVLILHGEKDHVIPFHNAQKLAKIKGKLVSFADGDHNNLTSYSLFWREVDGFMRSVRH